MMIQLVEMNVITRAVPTVAIEMGVDQRPRVA
jgi:hypothetical protein